VYILDTNILNILFHDNPAQQAILRNRLEAVDDRDVWVSVVTVYEMLIIGIEHSIEHSIEHPTDRSRL
jgi:predicted nucleic acid-binding protein